MTIIQVIKLKFEFFTFKLKYICIKPFLRLIIKIIYKLLMQYLYFQQVDGLTGKYLSHIGIFQMSCRQGELTYGMGIYQKQGKQKTFITLRQYWKQQKGKVFFKIQENTQLLSNFDLSQKHQYICYDVYNHQHCSDNRFIKLLMRRQENIEYSHLMFKLESLKGLCLKGGTIFSTTPKANKFYFIEGFFKTMVNRFECEDQVGLIFIYNKDSLRLLYGFYHSQGGQARYKYISKEKLAKPTKKVFSSQKSKKLQSQNIHKDKTIQLVDKPFNQYPYCSIGILLSYVPNQHSQCHHLFTKKEGLGQGTAFCLSKGTQCKFIMTCAHNFYDYKDGKLFDNRQPQKLKQYSFLMADRADTINLLDRVVDTRLSNFEILNLYIPEIYEKHINKMKSGNKINDQQIKFCYDIAVIQLKTPIKINNGFVIKSKDLMLSNEELKKKNVECAGFPGYETTSRTNKGEKIISGCMYHDSVVIHGNEEGCCFVREGVNQVIQHQLSTLPGCSGSPAFIHDKNQETAYVLGVHVAGCKEYNLASYIYNSYVYNWLLNIEGIQSVIKMKKGHNYEQVAHEMS